LTDKFTTIKTMMQNYREDIKKERARIIAKLIVEKNKGAKVIKPQSKKQNHFHCDSEESGW
jgi:hypothetical protein